MQAPPRSPLDLHDSRRDPAYTGKSAVGVVLTNGFALGATAESGFFLTASYFNHSCRSNVVLTWVPEEGVTVFHAARDIAAGEELCTTYLSPGQNSEFSSYRSARPWHHTFWGVTLPGGMGTEER